VHDADVSSTNATRRGDRQRVGAVPPAGPRKVCPKTSTGYMVRRGAGGSAAATTVVSVTPGARGTKSGMDGAPRQFDFDKSNIRQTDVPELQKAVEFVKRHPDRKISIEAILIASAPRIQPRLSEKTSRLP